MLVYLRGGFKLFVLFQGDCCLFVNVPSVCWYISGADSSCLFFFRVIVVCFFNVAATCWYISGAVSGWAG